MTTKLPTGVRVKKTRTGAITYEAQVHRPRVDGQRQSPLSKTFATAGQAEQWRDRTIAEMNRPTLSDRPTVTELHTRWAADGLGHLSRTTARNYADAVRLHLLPSLGDRELSDLRPSDLTAVYAKLCQERSRSTVERLAATTSAMLGWAVDEGMIAASPARGAKLPKRTTTDAGRKRTRVKGAWSPAELSAFLDSEPVRGSELAHWWLLAGHTGLRRGEVAALRPADVERKAGRPAAVLVSSAVTEVGGVREVGVPKSRGSRRRVPLSGPAARVVADRLAVTEPGGLLFGDVSLTEVSKEFGRSVAVFRRAHPEVATISLHGLRDTFATRLIDAGTPIATVSKLLGHASVSFTVDRYGHLLPDTADAAVAQWV